MKEIHCQEPWFSKIKHGIKKIEGRKYSAKYADLQPGDILKFFCNQDNFLVTVVKVVKYATLEDYLITEGIKNVLPGITCFNEAMNIYLGFNSREKLSKSDGFLAIHIERI